MMYQPAARKAGEKMRVCDGSSAVLDILFCLTLTEICIKKAVSFENQ